MASADTASDALTTALSAAGTDAGAFGDSTAVDDATSFCDDVMEAFGVVDMNMPAMPGY